MEQLVKLDEGDHLSEVVLVPHEQNDESDQLDSEKMIKILLLRDPMEIFDILICSGPLCSASELAARNLNIRNIKISK